MWMTALWHLPNSIAFTQWGAVLSASLVVAILDLRTWRIPNPIPLTLLLGGLIFSCIYRGGEGLADSIGGTLLLGVPFFVLFVVADGGAGDAKIMAALGSWLGLANGVIVLVAVTACGAILGIIYALSKNRMREVIANLQSITWSLMMVVSRHGRLSDPLPYPTTAGKVHMPYGLSIFVGTCVAAGGRLLWPM